MFDVIPAPRTSVPAGSRANASLCLPVRVQAVYRCHTCLSAYPVVLTREKQVFVGRKLQGSPDLTACSSRLDRGNNERGKLYSERHHGQTRVPYTRPLIIPSRGCTVLDDTASKDIHTHTYHVRARARATRACSDATPTSPAGKTRVKRDSWSTHAWRTSARAPPAEDPAVPPVLCEACVSSAIAEELRSPPVTERSGPVGPAAEGRPKSREKRRHASWVALTPPVVPALLVAM